MNTATKPIFMGAGAFGHQEDSAYNGHFGCTCYHPLFLFNQFSDLERVMLRRGNRSSAKYGRRVLLPVIERYRGLDLPKFFRGDAAFAGPKLLRLLEQEGWRPYGSDRPRWLLRDLPGCTATTLCPGEILGLPGAVFPEVSNR